MFMNNFTRCNADRFGVFIWVDSSHDVLARLGVYWVKAVAVWAIRIIFPNAHIHFLDTDAVLLPAALEQHVLSERVLGTGVGGDLLFTASDDGSYFNAGWIYIRKSARACVGVMEADEVLDHRWQERMTQIQLLADVCDADAKVSCPEAAFPQNTAMIQAVT